MASTDDEIEATPVPPTAWETLLIGLHHVGHIPDYLGRGQSQFAKDLAAADVYVRALERGENPGNRIIVA